MWAAEFFFEIALRRRSVPEASVLNMRIFPFTAWVEQGSARTQLEQAPVEYPALQKENTGATQAKRAGLVRSSCSYRSMVQAA